MYIKFKTFFFQNGEIQINSLSKVLSVHAVCQALYWGHEGG